MNWVNEFVQKEISSNITTDKNKKHMIDLIPMIDEALKILNPGLGIISVNAWDVAGTKKIVITFLETEED